MNAFGIWLNDEPEWTEVDAMATLISVVLVADVFGKTPVEVASDVLDLRKRNRRIW